MTSPAPAGSGRALPVSVKGVCFDHAGRVLLCLNWREEWELPGGRPETGEVPETCLEREIAEETGVRVSVRAPLADYAFEVLPGAWVRIMAFGCVPVAQPRVVPSREHRSVAFVDACELASLRLADGYRQAIAAWRAQ